MKPPRIAVWCMGLDPYPMRDAVEASIVQRTSPQPRLGYDALDILPLGDRR